MKKVRVVLPLTLEQRQMLAGALDVQFKSDTFPLQLELGYESEQTGRVEATALMGIDRIVVTSGMLTT